MGIVCSRCGISPGVHPHSITPPHPDGPDDCVSALRAEVERLKEAFANGGDPEFLGQVVRKAWVEWARKQPNPKPSWLVPWKDLGAADREADIEIGLAVANVCVTPALVKAEAALARIAGGVGRDLLGTTSLSREDMMSIAADALAAKED